MHTKRVCKDFSIKNSLEYPDFYLKSDTLIFVDVFKNFRNMHLKNFHLDPGKIFFSSKISVASSFRKD